MATTSRPSASDAKGSSYPKKRGPRRQFLLQRSHREYIDELNIYIAAEVQADLLIYGKRCKMKDDDTIYLAL